MKLTQKNYHSLKNRYLTGSRICDYLRSPKRLYDKHIAGTYKSEPTAPMILGSAVDAIVTGSMARFNKEFYTADLRKDEPQPGKTRLTKGQYEDAIAIASKLLSQTAVKEIKAKKYKSQVILTMDMPIGKHFCGLAFMLDWLGFSKDGETAIVIDLKTGGKPTAREWDWKCQEFGYYRQAGMAALLVRHNFPSVKYVDFRHVCVEKDNDDLYNCYTYRIDQRRIQLEAKKIMDEYVPMIAKDAEFKDTDCTWEDAVEVGFYETF